MHNRTRTLTVLLVLAIGSIAALGYMASRYSRILDEPATTQATPALRRVDQFIAVRRNMRREVDRHGVDGGQLTLSISRDRALALYGVDAPGYHDVRSAYRQWRAGEQPANAALASALEHRRDELRRLDLGDYESLDR